MRISRHQMWMEIAETVAKRSTCSRANNGAILIKHNNIISVGYNGPPSGEPHCSVELCEPSRGCTRSLHAEYNAITRAGDNAVAGADLYCTMSPCQACASLIVASGIQRVFFRYPYRELSHLHIPCFRLTQNGDIIEPTTGKILRQA